VRKPDYRAYTAVNMASGEAVKLGDRGGSREDRLQLVVVSGDEVRTIDLPKSGTFTIGRGEGNALRIDDPAVSRNHAVLHVDANLVIEDLGSANGTLVRDRARPAGAAETLNVRQLIGRKAGLAVGDMLMFGTSSVVVRHSTSVGLPDLAGRDAGIIVRDAGMRVVYQQAERAARSQISVLVLGETGVGKEVLARAIHERSPRSKGPFMGINCAAISESLLESELFGHEKGAFTGATAARAGLFETANGGTVFLDEVGELHATTQAKLLRVLEERVVTRLGSSRTTTIDVRFVAATNRDLEADSLAGRFRQDLFFRLHGLSLLIPPLRERASEIEPLVRKFLAAACAQIERTELPDLSPAALDLMRAYAWPGNVRELRNVVERAAVLCAGDTILPQHLPPSLTKTRVAERPALPSAPPGTESPPAPRDLHAEIGRLERLRITAALAQHSGNQSEAARSLGISRRTLVSRLNEYGLPRPRKRDDRP
jgi:two-component system response regulator AtoC